MRRDQLIEAIRAQTDLDEEDLPLATASLFLREAFQRTAAIERRWPTHEAEWEYTVAEGGVATLDDDTAEIISVTYQDTSQRLHFADHELIRSSRGATSGYTSFFSLWGGKMYFWPAPSEETVFSVSGYRKPTTSWLDNPSQEVDLDERLHIPLIHYAVSLAYAQQEDTELEATYMRRWEISTESLRADIMKTSAYRPIVLNGGLDLQRF